MEILDILALCGIPTTIVGLIVWRIKKSVDRAEAERRARDEKQHKYEMFQVRMIMAVAALCEANAIALQNGKCNGETHRALDYLKEVKREQREFLEAQGIEHLF